MENMPSSVVIWKDDSLKNEKEFAMTETVSSGTSSEALRRWRYMRGKEGGNEKHMSNTGVGPALVLLLLCHYI